MQQFLEDAQEQDREHAPQERPPRRGRDPGDGGAAGSRTGSDEEQGQASPGWGQAHREQGVQRRGSIDEDRPQRDHSAQEEHRRRQGPGQQPRAGSLDQGSQRVRPRGPAGRNVSRGQDAHEHEGLAEPHHVRNDPAFPERLHDADEAEVDGRDPEQQPDSNPARRAWSQGAPPGCPAAGRSA